MHSGEFRVSLRGFHRQDVLQYIDELQQQAMQNEQRLTSALHNALSRVNTLEEENASLLQRQTSLEEDNAQLEALVEEHNRTNRVLRAQAEAYPAVAQELERVQTALSECESKQKDLVLADNQRQEALRHGLRLSLRVRALEKQNRELWENLESVRGQIGSLHTQGQDFLAAAFRCGNESLSSLEATLSSLEEQLDGIRRRIGEQRASIAYQSDVTGTHLQELISLIQTEELPSSEEELASCRFFEEAADIPASPAVTASKPSEEPPTDRRSRDAVYVRRPSSDSVFKKLFGSWLPHEK